MKSTLRTKILKSLTSWGIVALFTVALLEGVLRIIAERTENSVQLLGKRWYYLAPPDVPEKMPSIESNPGDYRTYDPDLGWSIRSLGKESQDLIGQGKVELYYSNEFGYRCGQDTYLAAVARTAAEGAPPSDETDYKFVCIGDSFTHGDAVQFEESWPAYLQEITGTPIANLGVGGYGIDQAVLRYQKKNPRCIHVLLGLIAGDLERATHLIYNFPYGGLKSKPIFRFTDAGTEIENRPALYGNALQDEYEKGAESEFFQQADHSWNLSIVRRDFFDFSYCYRLTRSIGHWYRDRTSTALYRDDSPRLDYCIDILKYLKTFADTRNAKVTVIILGSANSFPEKEDGTDNWELFKSLLDESEIPWIDTSPEIHAMYKKDPRSVINSGDGLHYTPEANRTVAEIVAEHFTPKPARD